MGYFYIRFSCYSSDTGKVTFASDCTVPFCFHVTVVDIGI